MHGWLARPRMCTQLSLKAEQRETQAGSATGLRRSRGQRGEVGAKRGDGASIGAIDSTRPIDRPDPDGDRDMNIGIMSRHLMGMLSLCLSRDYVRGPQVIPAQNL